MMLVTARRISMVLVVVACAAPAPAFAAGCEVLHDPGDRAECVARQQARDAARSEVERRVGAAAPAAPADRPTTDGSRSAAWQRALEESRGVDASSLLEPRPIAAVGGLAWFLLVLRSRRRAKLRTRGA